MNDDIDEIVISFEGPSIFSHVYLIVLSFSVNIVTQISDHLCNLTLENYEQRWWLDHSCPESIFSYVYLIVLGFSVDIVTRIPDQPCNLTLENYEQCQRDYSCQVYLNLAMSTLLSQVLVSTLLPKFQIIFVT